MGIFDAAKGVFSGNKAYRAHTDGNKLAAEGKPAEAKEKFNAALALYEDAVKKGNVAPNILLAYALLLLREGKLDRANEVMLNMSRMKELSKDDWFQLRVQYSIYHWKMGDYDKAIETINRAAAHKMNGVVYGMLGMYWVDKAMKTGDFAPALEFNQRALDYDDEDASTLDNMGVLYEAMAGAEADGEKAREYREKAMDFYERAHKENPRQITTIYYMARMLHQNGDDARARELLSVRNSLYFSAICPITPEMMDALIREVG